MVVKWQRDYYLHSAIYYGVCNWNLWQKSSFSSRSIAREWEDLIGYCIGRNHTIDIDLQKLNEVYWIACWDAGYLHWGFAHIYTSWCPDYHHYHWVAMPTHHPRFLWLCEWWKWEINLPTTLPAACQDPLSPASCFALPATDPNWLSSTTVCSQRRLTAFECIPE